MTTALANKQGQLAPLKDVDPEVVLDRYLEGETGPQIAASLGVTKQALSHWLINRAEVQWKSAQLVKALARKDAAEELMDKASNPLDLARAREQLRGAQWDLERVCRRIYGQDSPANAAQAVQININLRGDAQTVENAD
jgi:transcriptional regulator with XRE-family HTH domain